MKQIKNFVKNTFKDVEKDKREEIIQSVTEVLLEKVEDLIESGLTEPDAIAMVTVKRITNWAVDNTDKVFWLTVDFHYESDRDSTPNKSPDFYT